MEKYSPEEDSGKGTRLLGLQPAEAMMVAAHKGDLAAAQAAGMYTAYVGVPEEDTVSEGFAEPSETHFDIKEILPSFFIGMPLECIK